MPPEVGRSPPGFRSCETSSTGLQEQMKKANLLTAYMSLQLTAILCYGRMLPNRNGPLVRSWTLSLLAVVSGVTKLDLTTLRDGFLSQLSRTRGVNKRGLCVTTLSHIMAGWSGEKKVKCCQVLRSFICGHRMRSFSDTGFCVSSFQSCMKVVRCEYMYLVNHCKIQWPLIDPPTKTASS